MLSALTWRATAGPPVLHIRNVIFALEQLFFGGWGGQFLSHIYGQMMWARGASGSCVSEPHSFPSSVSLASCLLPGGNLKVGTQTKIAL